MSSKYIFIRTFFLVLVLGLQCIVTSSASLFAHSNEEVHSLSFPANFTVALEDAFFSAAIPMMLPHVNEAMKNFEISPTHTKKFDVDRIKFNDFHIYGGAVTMASPNQLSVNVRGIDISIPDTKFIVRPGLITCGGTARFVIKNTNVSISLDVLRLQNGTLRLSVAESTFSWGNFQVSHTLSGFMCKAAEVVVSIVLGNLNKYIVSKVKKELPEEMKLIIEKKSPELLDQLPINFTESPVITAGRMWLVMDLVPGVEGKPLRMSKKLVASEALPARDVAALTTAASISNFLAYLSHQKKLNMTFRFPAEYNSSVIQPMFPDVFTLCPNCPFEAFFAAMGSPLLDLQVDETLVLQLTQEIVSLSMLSPSGSRIPVIDLLVNVTVGVTRLGFNTEDHLYFQLTPADLSLDVLKSNIGQLDPNTLSRNLRWMFNEGVVPLFNKEFNGIEIPPQVSRPFLNLSNKQIAIGLNLKSYPNIFSFFSFLS